MKVKTRQKFIDKNTKRLYRPGEIVDLTDERAAEISRTLPEAIENVDEPEKAFHKEEKPRKAKTEKKTAKSAKKSE